MQKYFAEAIGTFCLVFAGTGAIVIDKVAEGTVSHVGIGLTFGLIVMAMIYAIGDISGAHINPAVTLGFWVARQFPGNQVAPYIAAQTIGGIAASLLLLSMFGNEALLGCTQPAGPWQQTFTLETVLTFMLMFVILCVATGAKEKGIMAGAAIGGTVALEAIFAGPICGASMNPIRSVAPAIASLHFDHLWIYILAPILGAFIAVIAHRAIASSEETRAS